MTEESTKISAHYEALNKISNAIQQGVAGQDIDALVPMIQEADTHYKAIQARLDAIEAMLNPAE